MMAVPMSADSWVAKAWQPDYLRADIVDENRSRDRFAASVMKSMMELALENIMANEPEFAIQKLERGLDVYRRRFERGEAIEDAA